jgi:hypothetical protein
MLYHLSTLRDWLGNEESILRARSASDVGAWGGIVWGVRSGPIRVCDTEKMDETTNA